MRRKPKYSKNTPVKIKTWVNILGHVATIVVKIAMLNDSDDDLIAYYGNDFLTELKKTTS